jgi:hypothetical protein
MKLLAFIMAFWMLALNCLPCGDATCANEQEKTTLDMHQPHKDPCGSNDDHGCSPFCSCCCCGAFASLPAKPAQLVIQTKYIKKIPVTLTQKTIQVSKAVWQPPKPVDALV